MYTVALVQNQSEMSHYSYADMRHLLDGYPYRLFTGDDIGELAADLGARRVDALVLGSNALNDRSILRTLCNAEFAAELGGFLESGRGLLCLQQIGLAMRKGPTLDLLPPPLGQVRPIVRPPGESATTHTADTLTDTGTHVTLAYPKHVDLAAIAVDACRFRSRPGVYWHYWDQVDLAVWDVVAADTSTATHRSLVLATKESSRYRAVVSALPLDWQGHEALLHNLLCYAVEGRHNIAVLDADDDLAFDYLRRSLRARRIPYGAYTLPGDGAWCARNIAAGVHSTLLVGPGSRVEDLPAELNGPLEAAVRENRVRVVDIGERAYGTRRVALVSRELRPRALLHRTELQMQSELREGYIDDSFWSHVETLQTIDRMPDRIIDYGLLQEPSFAITRNHEQNDSYDEILGPTCAFYWMRARYLGVDSPEAQRTAAWLRLRVRDHDVHERALAYLMFASVGGIEPAETAELRATAAGLDLADLSETEILLFLRALIAAAPAPPDLVARLAEALVRRQQPDGYWVDLTTTASAATALLLGYEVLVGDEYAAARGQVERACLAAVTDILQVLTQVGYDPEGHPYPWEGKARTTTKCLQAWLLFDALLDLPVSEMLDMLQRAEGAASASAASRSALGVLEAAAEETAGLRVRVAELERGKGELAAQSARAVEASRSAGRRVLWRSVALAVILTVLYLVATLLVGGLVATKGDIARFASAGFVDGSPLHFTVIGAVVAVALTWVTQRQRGRPAAGSDETPDEPRPGAGT